jgi:hypothetical protein
MGDEPNDPATSPSGPDTQPDQTPPSDKLQAIEAQLGGQPPATVTEQESEVPSKGDAPLSGDVNVDWGEGTVRKTTIEELVAAAKRADEVQQMAAAVDEKLADMGKLRQLGEILDSLDQDQLGELQKLIANPAELTAMAQGQRQPSQPLKQVEADDDDFLGTRKPVPVANDPELTDLKRTVKALTNYVEADLADKRKTSLADTVATEMAAFPVFKQTKGAAEMAKTSILNELGMTPNANLRNIVANHATRLHQLLLNAREGVVHERTGETPSRTTTPVLKKDWKPTADDLLQKNILRAAEEAFYGS